MSCHFFVQPGTTSASLSHSLSLDSQPIRSASSPCFVFSTRLVTPLIVFIVFSSAFFFRSSAYTQIKLTGKSGQRNSCKKSPQRSMLIMFSYSVERFFRLLTSPLISRHSRRPTPTWKRILQGRWCICEECPLLCSPYHLKCE